MLMGTSCALSSRFCAVTMTSSMVKPSCATAIGAAATPETNATAPAEAKDCRRIARTTGFKANERSGLLWAIDEFLSIRRGNLTQIPSESQHSPNARPVLGSGSRGGCGGGHPALLRLVVSPAFRKPTPPGVPDARPRTHCLHAFNRR